MKKLLLFALTFTVVTFSHAQKNEVLKDFDYVVKRIKNDYPGFNDKVNKTNKLEFKNFQNNLRKKIQLYPDSCRIYLEKYTAWFKDTHLRVLSKKKSKSIIKHEYGKKEFFNFPNINIEKTNNPIEGVWCGSRGSIRILKESENTLVGVSIDYRKYIKDQIIFRLTPTKENNFKTINYSYKGNNKPILSVSSLLLDNKIFEIHGNTHFVKKTDNEKYDKALLYSYQRIFPNGRNIYPLSLNLSDSTFYLRIPSFSDRTSDKLVSKHWDEIMSHPNLIIDIRYNGGGQDYYYEILSKLIYTNPYETKGVEWYSTKGIISDWEEAIKLGRIKKGSEDECQALVNIMKENVGGFVRHPFNGKDGIVVKDTVYPNPKRVGIIINGGNASSAEQFILTAKHSSKVLTFGAENTKGVLDYSNSTPKELPSGKYSIRIPATRSCRLPDNPIDNIGIAPDINIPFTPTKQLYDRLDSWVYFVKTYMELQ